MAHRYPAPICRRRPKPTCARHTSDRTRKRADNAGPFYFTESKNRAALAVAEGLVQQAITQRANSMGTDMGFGGAGLLGQKAFLIDQLNAMDFDMTRQPKQS